MAADLAEEWSLIRLSAAHCPECAVRWVLRFIPTIDAILALTRDTDGNDLGGDETVPVGEFQAALWNGLLGEEAPSARRARPRSR